MSIISDYPEESAAVFALHKLVSYRNEKDLEETELSNTVKNQNYLSGLIHKYSDDHPIKIKALEYEINTDVRLGHVDQAIAKAFTFNEKYSDLECGKRVLLGIADIHHFVTHDEEAARKVYALFVEKYPDHPMSEYAKLMSQEPPSFASTGENLRYESTNYPNPFNSETVIQYSLPESGRVIVKVYDIRGSEVITLVDEEKSAGRYTAHWDGKNRASRDVTSGMYFYQIKFKNLTLSDKMILMR